jgi:hypothetical protein
MKKSWRKEDVFWWSGTILLFGPSLAVFLRTDRVWVQLAVMATWFGYVLATYAWRLRFNRLGLKQFDRDGR